MTPKLWPYKKSQKQIEAENERLRRLRAELQDYKLLAEDLGKVTDRDKAEIEQLRASTDTSIKDQIIASHVDAFMKQEAEIERLRAALLFYAERTVESEDGGMHARHALKQSE